MDITANPICSRIMNYPIRLVIILRLSNHFPYCHIVVHTKLVCGKKLTHKHE